MSREEAIAELHAIQQRQLVHGDLEADHEDADRVICKLLTALGYGDVVEEWDVIEKWYA